MPDGKKPVILPTDAISTIFGNITAQVQSLVRETKNVVDLELNFRSVKVDKSGIPIFSARSNESTIEIRLATRITPEDIPPPPKGSEQGNEA